MARDCHGRILIVDDDKTASKLGEAILTKAGYVTASVATVLEAREELAQRFYDAMLLDLDLAGERGLDVLAHVLKVAPFTKVIILTASSSIAQAVECMKRGASGFVQKGSPPDVLMAELAKHLTAPAPVGPAASGNYGLIGDSPSLKETVATIDRLKSVDSTVLILGESGTGKEVVARALHDSSKRGAQLFSAINCGAIPENLLESELFGHRKGSFTDAKADRKGIFELCTNGTLLLDEIGDMPLVLQTKLLRVLQERTVTPIGASTPIPIGTRVIAATHRDILDEARSKRFREDLYYRLSIVIIRIPPLRHRTEDIPLLTDHFLKIFNQRFSREVRMPPHTTMARMVAYDWPGNVRELQNAIERAVVLSTDGELTTENMFQHLAPGREADPKAAAGTALLESAVFNLPLTEAKQAFERAYLERLLRENSGNISEVARLSGRYRADVYRLLQRAGLETDQYR